ncbi:MAG: SRPBCC domain-containing protein [Bacteroidia bacterium]
METTENTKKVTVETTVNARIEVVWKLWTEPRHIKNWYNASDEWYVPAAENNLRVNGKFKITMSSKDDDEHFDFEGVYTKVDENKLIEYTINDGRKVKIIFSTEGKETVITETFEIENIHPAKKQKDGWQSILNNFKKYVEAYQFTGT